MKGMVFPKCLYTSISKARFVEFEPFSVVKHVTSSNLSILTSQVLGMSPLSYETTRVFVHNVHGGESKSSALL